MPNPAGADPAGTPPRGADLYRQVCELPERELIAFAARMVRDKESQFGQFIQAIFEVCGSRGKQIDSLSKRIESLLKKLKRHSRPKKNAERDAEIMRLHREGKTAGQVVKAIAGRWKVSDRVVTAVISRERKKPSSRTAR